MNYTVRLFLAIAAVVLLGVKTSSAQVKEESDSVKIEFNDQTPMMSARETPKRYYIRKVNV